MSIQCPSWTAPFRSILVAAASWAVYTDASLQTRFPIQAQAVFGIHGSHHGRGALFLSADSPDWCPRWAHYARWSATTVSWPTVPTGAFGALLRYGAPPTQPLQKRVQALRTLCDLRWHGKNRAVATQ